MYVFFRHSYAESKNVDIRSQADYVNNLNEFTIFSAKPSTMQEQMFARRGEQFVSTQDFTMTPTQRQQQQQEQQQQMQQQGMQQAMQQTMQQSVQQQGITSRHQTQIGGIMDSIGPSRQTRIKKSAMFMLGVAFRFLCTSSPDNLSENSLPPFPRPTRRSQKHGSS